MVPVTDYQSVPVLVDLIGELVEGQAAAVRETRAVDAATVDRWEAVTRTGAEVGHVDTLGLPPPGFDDEDNEGDSGEL